MYPTVWKPLINITEDKSELLSNQVPRLMSEISIPGNSTFYQFNSSKLFFLSISAILLEGSISALTRSVSFALKLRV